MQPTVPVMTPSKGTMPPSTSLLPPSKKHAGMAGETGGNQEGPSPPGPINSISWVGPGGPNT